MTSESSAKSMVDKSSSAGRHSATMVAHLPSLPLMNRPKALNIPMMNSEFSAKLKFVASSSGSAQLNTGPMAKHTFQGLAGDIASFVFLHDNVHIVSGSRHGTMRKWNCETGLPVGDPWKGQDGAIIALALSPDGKTIACLRTDGSVERWNMYGEIIEGTWSGHSDVTDVVQSLSWSPSGGHIASGHYDGTILIRKAESGQVELGPIKTNHHRHVWSVVYSPLGDRIASAGDNSICIWDSYTGKLLVGPIESKRFSSSAVWSSDGSKLYSVDSIAHVFDTTQNFIASSLTICMKT